MVLRYEVARETARTRNVNGKRNPVDRMSIKELTETHGVQAGHDRKGMKRANYPIHSFRHPSDSGRF